MDKVKICAGCGAINAPDEVLCTRCQLMLPASTVPRPETPTPTHPAAPNNATIRLDSPPEPRATPTPSSTAKTPDMPARVTVVDFDISFWNLVQLLVKTALAAAPALFILGLITAGIVGILRLFVHV